jgi:hypothetical protein
LHSGLPFVGVVLCLGQLCNVERGVAERHEWFAFRAAGWVRKIADPKTPD